MKFLTALLLLISVSAQADSIVVGGVSYAHGSYDKTVSEKYGVGLLLDNGIEAGGYRNARKSQASYSGYVTYGRPVFSLGKLDLGLRAGVSVHDGIGGYSTQVKPVAQVTLEHPFVLGSKLRLSTSYSVANLSLIIPL